MEQPAETLSESIDPRRLLIFREVAHRGSLSAAATALGWTQPAVGQHVQRLERDLGMSLALRSTRGVTLTEAGVALLAHADAMASRLAAADEEMRALRTLRGGRLRLAAFPSACAALVPEALGRLADEAPDLDVRLTELEPAQAGAAVLAGEVDLALVFQYVGAQDEDEHRDLTIQPLMDDPVLAVLPAEHRLAGRVGASRGIALADLARERWVAGCPRCRTHLHSLAVDAGFHPDIRHSTDDYVVVQSLVAAGLAVALLPRLALSAFRDARVVAARISGNPARRISVIHRREAATMPAVQAGLRALVAPQPVG
ncbi:MAG: LysR family transcriptional regulator [Pseudonocardiales bacterium]|nr:MAG: LysR family transcriptional regulator [Pseudonocardiales bacterium]